MTQNEQNVTGIRSPQQVAAGLFRIGENPTLPAWQYPVLQQAIALLVSQVEQPEPYGWATPGSGNYFTRNEAIAKRIGGLIPIYLASTQVGAWKQLSNNQRAAVEFALGACAGHVAGERHVPALESLLSGSQEGR